MRKRDFKLNKSAKFWSISKISIKNGKSPCFFFWSDKVSNNPSSDYCLNKLIHLF